MEYSSTRVTQTNSTCCNPLCQRSSSRTPFLGLFPLPKLLSWWLLVGPTHPNFCCWFILRPSWQTTWCNKHLDIKSTFHAVKMLCVDHLRQHLLTLRLGTHCCPPNTSSCWHQHFGHLWTHCQDREPRSNCLAWNAPSLTGEPLCCAACTKISKSDSTLMLISLIAHTQCSALSDAALITNDRDGVFLSSCYKHWW